MNIKRLFNILIRRTIYKLCITRVDTYFNIFVFTILKLLYLSKLLYKQFMTWVDKYFYIYIYYQAHYI